MSERTPAAATSPAPARPGGAPRLCLFGAAGDTGNLGVSALLHSTLGALARLSPEAEVTVFDNGWGVREAEGVYGGRAFRYRLCGARLSRRLHRPESYWNMRVSAFLGGLANPGARAVREADAVWDVTGGDSFADLYGARHLRAMVAPKRLALDLGVPLVLLPQTYGPFHLPSSRRAARAILAGAALAWARDARSFEALRELAGADFDPERHRLGVDVAFGLEARAPRAALPEAIAGWLHRPRSAPLVGLNVSGLIANDPRASERFGLEVDYRAALRALVERLLERSDARVLLVPHVLVPDGAVESDPLACRALRAELPRRDLERVEVLPAGLDQSETKWVLGQLDWFCGTRMHACIGALSSGVPAAGVAYSPKTRGVFETCGQGERVADLRRGTAAELVELLWRAWEERAQAAAVLAERLPEVRRTCAEQMELTLAASGPRASRAGRRGGREGG